MSKMSQLRINVSKKYNNKVIMSVKQFMPTLIKSIKKPDRGVPGAIKIRELLIESTDISDSSVSIDRYELALLLLLVDYNSSVTSLWSILSSQSKMTDAIGKIIVLMMLYMSYIKAKISTSKISNLNDTQKLQQFIKLGFLNPIIKLVNNDIKIINTFEISSNTMNKTLYMLKQGNITYEVLGAIFLNYALSIQINKKSSEAVAKKYNFLNNYDVIITGSEIAKNDGVEINESKAKNIIKDQTFGVLMQSIKKILHKKGLSWAEYVIHFAWNLLAASIVHINNKKVLQSIE